MNLGGAKVEAGRNSLSRRRTLSGPRDLADLLPRFWFKQINSLQTRTRLRVRILFGLQSAFPEPFSYRAGASLRRRFGQGSRANLGTAGGATPPEISLRTPVSLRTLGLPRSSLQGRTQGNEPRSARRGWYGVGVPIAPARAWQRIFAPALCAPTHEQAHITWGGRVCSSDAR